MVLGYGPIFCQCEYGKVGGHCDWTYTWRLMWITVLRLLQWAVFAKFEHYWLITELCTELETFYIPSWMALIVCFLAGLDHGQTLAVMTALFAINSVYRRLIPNTAEFTDWFQGEPYSYFVIWDHPI